MASTGVSSHRIKNQANINTIQMKKTILSAALVSGVLAVSAQKQVLSVGNTTSLTIKAGTVFSADSLVLTPSADFTLSSNAIQESATAAGFPPAPAINRQYNFASQITFTGTIQLYYQPSELNGNTESTLEYADSATGAAWLPEATSTVNTSLHYVQFVASAQSFVASTASGPVIDLPITLVSFTGNWNEVDPVLNWVVDQTGGAVTFNIQSSTDGTMWDPIGTELGLNNNALDNYQFGDPHPPAQNMFYRIELIQPSGQSSYSNIVHLQKSDNGNVILVTGSNSVSVHFSGTLPAGIRLINISGQVLRTDMTSKQEYDLYGLNAGVYFLQYELNGQWAVREFVID
jgi:hypothetical protein